MVYYTALKSNAVLYFLHNAVLSFAGCYLYAFGSSVNKLGMKNCDLDLVLLTNGAINEVPTNELLV